MLMLLIVIAIIITIAISDLHDSSHRSFAFTSAFFDMRSSTVDACPIPADGHIPGIDTSHMPLAAI
jgi:hypothetical protein